MWVPSACGEVGPAIRFESDTDASSAVRFGLRHGTAVEVLPDCAVLFSEQDQEIHRLNPSSAVLAARLEAGGTFRDLAGELCNHGLDATAASQWVSAFLNQLSQLALLTGDWPSRRAMSHVTQYISLGGVNLALHFPSAELFELTVPSYAHMAVEGVPIDIAYQLSSAGEFVFIGKDDSPALAVEREMAGVRLKGMLIEEILRSAHERAALHAACVTAGERALLLLGSPGSGKTTLSLALMKQGFRYGSDDVTLVRPDGIVSGLPLAPGVKEGAWPIVDSLVDRLRDQPVHLRPDGQKVRFVSVSRDVLARPCRVANIVNLCRADDTRALLEPISSSEGLSELLRESRSPDGRCSTEIMRGLVEVVRDAACFNLRYTEASDAVPLLCELVGSD